ncbi:unnamed protein product [Ceutorhynchus assimilis]|uniref:Uncharacterized protein n=1 Tax=Ceutorhynchus assimilis TaxID=467358 RepID=A0A9N9MKC3_9CUCU|nr:unnamed protein product [Ceutorhynchus assimilis]
MKKMACTLKTEKTAYVSPVLKKQVPQRIMKPRCDSQKCKNEDCKLFTEEEQERQKIFHAFYNTMSSITEGAHYINETYVYRRKTAATESR